MAHDGQPAAFTMKFSNRAPTLETNVEISEPYDPILGGPLPKIIEFKAVWDTGASRTAITQKVIDTLGIQQIDEVDNYTANGMRTAGVYLVNVYLPNKVAFSGIRVIDGDIYGTDALIGMDIIGQGDFAVTHRFEKTWMTFQIPSTHNIDFVDEINIKGGKKGFRKTPKRNSKKRK